MTTVDFLKIDCEGAEIEVLNSISRKNKKRIKHIALEYHNNLVTSEDRIIENILTEHGFETSKEEDPYNKNIGYIFGKQ